MALRTRTPGARAFLPATRCRASGQLGALLSSPVLGVRLLTALQVLQVPRKRWSREKLAEMKGGSGGSDTNNEGNGHTAR